MSKLIAPVGTFRIFYNATEIEYRAVKLDVDYRKVEYGNESGERLECRSIYQDNIKLSIGIKCDTYYLD